MLSNVDNIQKLEVPSLSAGRIPAYLKANLLAARNITDRPVFAGCIGPYSLAGRLYDMSELMMLIFENPDAAHTLLSKCTGFIKKYCEALKATGVGGVMMAEPAAGLLSDEDCQTFSSNYVRYIVEQVQSDDFIVVLHNCGNTGHCTRAMVSTGAAAYHFGNKCQMEEVIRDVPPTALAMGNIDPVSIFKDGTPEQMHQVVMELLEKMKDYPNFVLSSGCDAPPHTPLANIDAFFKALEEFNRQ
jgi:uroporphyrinogen decarboxylase